MAKHRCFISAAYGAQLQVLQRVLDSYQVRWEWPVISPISEPILGSIVGAIKKADFIVCVLHGDTPSQNVLIEIGMAIGLGKPLLVLSVGKTEIPFDLSGSTVFVTDLHNEKLLSFHLDLFLRSLSERRKSKASPQPSLPTIRDATPLQLFDSDLEQSTAVAIARVGGRVTIPSRTSGERTPDLLMWLPQFDKNLFNPAAVEVTGGTADVDLETLKLRLASFVRSTGLQCGLIVVNSVALEREARKLKPIPYVFVLTLNELKAKLQSSELASWVKHERNRLAHGVR